MRSRPVFGSLSVALFHYILIVSPERLKEVFQVFGSVIDSVVMYDNCTGRSRGFGFVTFASNDCAQNALWRSKHNLDGKEVRRSLESGPCDGEK